MTTFASRRIDIFCIKFKINTRRPLQQRNSPRYMWGSAFYLTCAKLLHDRIFSLRREASVHKTRLIPPGLIEMPVKALPSLKQTEMQSLKVRHQALHEDITIQQNIIKCWLDYTKYNNAKGTVFFKKDYFCICSTFISHDGWIYTFNICNQISSFIDPPFRNVDCSKDCSLLPSWRKFLILEILFIIKRPVNTQVFIA